MPDPAVKYAIEVHKKYRTYWPTWIPSERVAIGDFGELHRGIFFKRLGHVSECGISKAALKTNPAKGRDDLYFRSKGRVRVRLQADGANAIPGLGIPPGRVGGRIKFTRANAAFLAAVGVKVRALRSEHKLRAELTAKVESREFPADYVVVTDLLDAESGRVFISSARGESVMLHAKAAVGAAPLQLASLGGRLDMAADSEAMMSFDGTQGMTPLFKIMGFSVGSALRHLRRTVFSRGRDVPRIRVESIGAAPRVGRQITVSPLASQRLVFAQAGKRPFAVELAEFKPFAVEPTLIDTPTLGAIFPEQLLGGVSEVFGGQGVLVGTLEGEPAADEEVLVRTLRDSPFVIEPLDGDPFLVKMPEGQELAFESARLDFLETSPLGTELAELDEDPLSFGYVDFDAELAAAASGVELDLELQ